MKHQSKLKLVASWLGATVFVVGLGLAWPIQAKAAASTNRPYYVDFGDSLTTGSSIATCKDDRTISPWGCKETPFVQPYATKVAQAMHWSFSNRIADVVNNKVSIDTMRAGIWGYTVQEAAADYLQGHNQAGSWTPQLQAVRSAVGLVTGTLGINDLRFSDVAKWGRLYLSSIDDKVTPAVQTILADRSADFDQLFAALDSARSNGAKPIIGLYYNPYDSGDQECSDLKSLGDRMVNTLDDELQQRARANHLTVVDYRRRFAGHGSGSHISYVFGQSCRLSDALVQWLPKWLGGGGGRKAVAVAFDPHPNNVGTAAIAQMYLEAYNNAD